MKYKIERKKAPITKVLVKQVSYYEAVAWALVEYSKNDNQFANYLANKIVSFPNVDKIYKDKEEIVSNIKLLMPSDFQTAVEKTDWLIKTIKITETEGKKVLYVLKSQVKPADLNSPQSLVIGIVGMALPGPTLGVISTKKKKRMSIIVDKKFAQENKIEFANTVIKVSHELLKKELIKSNKDIESLDPDIADWFFGDKEIAFYESETEKINDIKNELNDLNVVFVEKKDNNNNSILAISPAVNDNYQELFWNLERI